MYSYYLVVVLQSLSCPSLCDSMNCSTPGFPDLHCLTVCSNSQLLTWWCYPTISCKSTLLLPSSFPASGSVQMSQLFTSDSQSIGASASSSILPMNIQGWFLLGLTSLTFMQSKGLSRVIFSTTIQKHQKSILWCSAFFMVELSYPYMTTGKTIALIFMDLCRQSDISAFYTLSRFVTAFLQRSKSLLISWFQSPSAVILEPKDIKFHYLTFSPSICHEVMGLMTWS